jgi:hypothetical protein
MRGERKEYTGKTPVRLVTQLLRDFLCMYKYAHIPLYIYTLKTYFNPPKTSTHRGIPLFVYKYAHTLLYIYICLRIHSEKTPPPLTALTLLRFSCMPLKPTLYTLKTHTHRGIPLYMYKNAHVPQCMYMYTHTQRKHPPSTHTEVYLSICICIRTHSENICTCMRIHTCAGLWYTFVHVYAYTARIHPHTPHTCGSGFRVQGSGFRVYGLGITVGEEEDSLAFLFDPLSPAAR